MLRVMQLPEKDDLIDGWSWIVKSQNYTYKEKGTFDYNWIYSRFGDVVMTPKKGVIKYQD